MAIRRSLRFQLFVLTIPLALVLLSGALVLIVHLSVMPKELSSGVIAVSLILVCGGVAGSLILFRMLVRPLAKLKTYAGEIARGDFDTRLSVSADNELGEVAEAFNFMSQEIARAKQKDAQHIQELQEAKTAAEAMTRAKSAIMAEMAQEIDRRKAAEAATEFFVDAIPIAIIALTGDGVITRWNEAATEILGVGRSLVFARRLSECGVHWLDAGQITAFEHSLEQKTEVRVENAAFLKGGQDKRLLALTARRIAGHSYSYAYVVMAADVTERRFLETQVNHAQKMEAIGQLSAGIAHEINTPIQYVGDNLMFLSQSWKSVGELVTQYRHTFRELGEPGLTEQQRQTIAEVERAADFDFLADEMPKAIEQALDGSQRVAKIVRAMKEFSHPGSSERTAVDINKAVETTVTVARNEWKYVANVQALFDPNLPLVPCYAGELNQVILNLIVNAAHAIEEVVCEGKKGVINVRTVDKGDWAEIQVSDTGPGVPAEIRTRIFDPFFTTKQVGKGTGQGLAMAHSVIVKKHGGKIWFETEMGHGTTFFVHLPLTPVAEEA